MPSRRKLVRDAAGTPFELYNMRDDPGETKNLAKQNPERLAKMIKVLEAHMAKAKVVPWQRPKE